MISRVQGHPEHTTRSVYHQGLIKLLILAQLQKEGRTWESLLTELGFKDNPKEKGKRMMENTDQQTTSPKKPIQTVEKEGNNTTDKPIQEGLCPEASYTNENPEKLSVMLKNIASKSEIRKQLLKTEKPRTRLRKKLQTEKRSAHEDVMEVVMIDDALSEETVHTSKDQYCADIERFVDIQGVAGSIPEAFYTNK